ncbi:MAG: hypothetical protein DCC54_14515 [Anaerolineae bacterium]|nr:MAG: hypothetical protein DCC54_14515 [Anaerolineae bacterium]
MLNHKQLLDGFRQTRVKAGDTLLVHTSYKSLGGVEGGADTVIDVMRELAGERGTVLFPAFNFQSWTETHYFDVLETPSKMGTITELARLRPDAKRTPHPIYSFSVWLRLSPREGVFGNLRGLRPSAEDQDLLDVRAPERALQNVHQPRHG